jgi:ABC-type amino acid transport substrate-binding protein
MIDIEPGIAPAWRPSEGEAAISRYTQPFMKMDDVLIFPAVKPLPAIRSMDELSKLKGLKVGQVRGFFVPPGLDLSLMANERDIARLVDAGVLDGGFMNASVAAYFKSEYGYGYQASPPFASTPVCLRLHVRHAAWLAPFNDAIEELRRTGELQHILEISR